MPTFSKLQQLSVYLFPFLLLEMSPHLQPAYLLNNLSQAISGSPFQFKSFEPLSAVIEYACGYSRLVFFILSRPSAPAFGFLYRREVTFAWRKRAIGVFTSLLVWKLWINSKHIQQGGDPGAGPEHIRGIINPIWSRNTSGSPRRSWRMWPGENIWATTTWNVRQWMSGWIISFMLKVG